MNLKEQKIKHYRQAVMEWVGPESENPDVSYEEVVSKGVLSKIIAHLKGNTSGKYSRLAQNLVKMRQLQEDIAQIKKDIDLDARQTIADVFNAEDEIYTRVVDTISFIVKITAKPKPAVTYEYSKILAILEKELTPELLKRLYELKDIYSKETQKASTLSYEPKIKEALEQDGIFSKLASIFKHYLDLVLRWGKVYDEKLSTLEQDAIELD
ncbi:Uncharacterised protein [uncultured archaeon]|nr:Uncharacterised protein [uncultured archaeon]